jgi:MoxR-like ATPase
MGMIQKNMRFENYERLEFEGKNLWAPYPVKIPNINYVEWGDLIEKGLAAWMKLDGLAPLNFRLYGPPGVGKNAVVYKLAQVLQKDLYIINGHEELRPEDIACTPVMTSGGTIEYVGSPIFSAALRGGILFFDEIGKAPVSALDPLASLLDDRRVLTSIIAGIHLQAHKDFLFCAALNEDEEDSIGLPGFIDERTRPAIYVGYPDAKTVEKILRSNIPDAADIWFSAFLKDFGKEELSPRNSITLLKFALGLFVKKNEKLGKDVKNPKLDEKEARRYLAMAKEYIEKRNKKERFETEKENIEREKKEKEDVGIRLSIPSIFQKNETLH